MPFKMTRSKGWSRSIYKKWWPCKVIEARGLKFCMGPCILYGQYTCHIKIEAQSEKKNYFLDTLVETEKEKWIWDMWLIYFDPSLSPLYGPIHLLSNFFWMANMVSWYRIGLLIGALNTQIEVKTRFVNVLRGMSVKVTDLVWPATPIHL